MPRGKYIVIEGGDGTGKSTQAELLTTTLNETGLDTLLVEEPGSTPIGDKLRPIIKDAELLREPLSSIMLFTANRIELWKQIIEPRLSLGKWVVSARNWYSTLAYQGYGEGVDLDFIESFTAKYVGTQYMHPDLSLIITHNSNEEISKRINDRGKVDVDEDYYEQNNNIDKHTVDESYKHIARKLGVTALDIDGLNINEVRVKIWGIVTSELQIR